MVRLSPWLCLEAMEEAAGTSPNLRKTIQYKALYLVLSGGGQENQSSELTGNS